MPGRGAFPVTRNQRVDTEKVRFAKILRHNMTPEERILWNRLRRSALAGLHFHRQQIIVGFIADFYCAAANLAIELDGPIHDGNAAADRKRDRAFAELGIRTLRIRNEELEEDLEGVLAKIAAACGRPNP